MDIDWTAQEEDWAEGRETAKRAPGSRRSLPGMLEAPERQVQLVWRGRWDQWNGVSEAPEDRTQAFGAQAYSLRVEIVEGVSRGWHHSFMHD